MNLSDVRSIRQQQADEALQKMRSMDSDLVNSLEKELATLKAQLAHANKRLEAAEKLIQAPAMIHQPWCHFSISSSRDCSCGYSDALKAWEETKL